MITLNKFLELIQYKINDSSEYSWDCFGPNARSFEYWNGMHGSENIIVSCIFDTVDQTVYCMEAWDGVNDAEYRWTHPDYIDDYKEEARVRNVDFEQSYDDHKFTDLDLADDIMEKARAIFAGEDYDRRVMISIELDDDLMFSAMKFAHEADITLNQYIENILSEEVARLAMQA